MSKRLAGLRLPGQEGLWDLRVVDGRIAAIRPSTREDVRLLALPAFAEPHVHADRAYLAGPRRPESLEDAIALVQELRAEAEVEDIVTRAGRLLLRCARHGATHVRTHVDVDQVVELRALQAVSRARDAVGTRLTVEIVAFATAFGDPATAEGLARLETALEAGADLLGGVASLYDDPERSLGALFGLAADRGVGVDVHVDETVARDGTQLARVARFAREFGLQGRVTASHCSALASLPKRAAERTIAALASAEVTVVTLPALNLSLLDRAPGRTPRLRGVTLVRELLAAGVPVRFGSDNVRDVFYPYGDADPLEAAFLTALAAHVDDEAALLAGICGGRSGIARGDRADLVLIPAESLTDAIARRPGGRVVLHGGQMVGERVVAIPAQ